MANTKNAPEPKNAKNTGVNAKGGSDLPNFDEWEEEQVGFAPYWNPEEGKFFYGSVVARDDRDPEFSRYLVLALMDTECKRGPVDAAEDVLVKKGEYFSVSVYHALAEPFDFYLENFTAQGNPLPMHMTAVRKTKTRSGNTCWNWKLKVPPKYKAQIAAAKNAARLARAADETERKALEAANA